MSHYPSKTRRRPHTATATATQGVGRIGPWSARPDEDLLVEYAEKGTREAFEELVHRYEREMYGYLRRFLRSAELAEDAFQAAFLQVHLNCRQFDPRRKFRPWLYRIATTRAIDLMRQNRRHKAISLNAEPSDRGSSERADGPRPREFPRCGPQRAVRSRRSGPGNSIGRGPLSRTAQGSARAGDVPRAQIPGSRRHARNSAGLGEEPIARGHVAPPGIPVCPDEECQLRRERDRSWQSYRRWLAEQCYTISMHCGPVPYNRQQGPRLAASRHQLGGFSRPAVRNARNVADHALGFRVNQ